MILQSPLFQGTHEQSPNNPAPIPPSPSARELNSSKVDIGADRDVCGVLFPTSFLSPPPFSAVYTTVAPHPFTVALPSVDCFAISHKHKRKPCFVHDFGLLALVRRSLDFLSCTWIDIRVYGELFTLESHMIHDHVRVRVATHVLYVKNRLIEIHSISTQEPRGRL